MAVQLVGGIGKLQTGCCQNISQARHADAAFASDFRLFEGKRLVGMYQLQWRDLFVRPDLYPWLANVYVDPAYRKCGYGDAMLKSVGAMLKRYTSFRECYLYTTHTSLYEKYGWQFVSEIDTYLPEQRMQRLYRLSIN